MSDFSVDDVLKSIVIDGESAYDDIQNVIEILELQYQAEEVKESFLMDMVETDKISTDNLINIYNLISDGAMFEYPISAIVETEDKEAPPEYVTQMVGYIKNDKVHLNTMVRTAHAILANILNTPIQSELLDEGTVEGKYSDFAFYSKYDTIEPGFVITADVFNNSPFEKYGRGIGFFEKLFPDDEHLKYDFNSDDDNMFCVFSALFRQDPSLFDKCGYTFATNSKGNKMSEEEIYISIIDKCGLYFEDTFSLTADKIREVYQIFAETFKLDISITYYYLKPIGVIPKVISNLSHKTFKFGNPVPREPYVIAKLGNHMFNINGKNTKRSDALKYLQKVANMYDTLKDRHYSDYKTFSRKHAKQINDYHSEQLLHPDRLLIGIPPEELYIAPSSVGENNMGTDNDKVKYIPFVFDFETVLNEKNEHCIYSYVIKKVESYESSFYYNKFPFEQKSKDEVLKKLFQFVIDNTKEEERAILLAHNGANFDNLLILDMACNSTSMHSFKEISTGPGNNIMLSLDITYNYKAKPQDRKVCSKVISFRDSYKLLDCAASRIPSNYGIKTFKLPYSYKFYNKIFNVPNKNITRSGQAKQMKHYIKTESDMAKFDDEEFANEYKRIASGEILKDKDISAEMKLDIVKYLNKLKESGTYYSPEDYCHLYNSYDVIVVEQGLLKMQEYIRCIGSQETILKLIEENMTTPNAKIASLSKSSSKIYELVKNNPEMCIPAAANLDIFKYRSLASLVFNLCKDDGVFDNIYKLVGNLKTFIQLSVVGGKVMKNPQPENNIYQSEHYDYFMNLQGKDVNDKDNAEIVKRAINDSIIDNDAVSLYPSAISLCEMPAGKPIIVNITDPIKQVETAALIDKFQSKCHFSLENKPTDYSSTKNNHNRIFYCLDLETNTDLEFPILSIKDGEGIRRFKNGKFNKIVIGDVALADVLKYQGAKVTKVYTMVIFTSTCDKFAKFIKTLFTLRVIFKAVKLPCQNAIKLLMNSSYGRTILKQNLYKKVFKRVATEAERQKFLRYVAKNYNTLKPEVIRLGAFVKIQKHDLKAQPEGYPHVGSHILEMSKKLMNSMFNKLYSNGYIVYYTDTDSIHVKAGSLSKIGDMLGEEMTQFHSDFGADGYYGVSSSEVEQKVTPGIFAIKSIFVMKKCYYDKLFCINAKTKKYEIIEHKRVKGISSEFMTEERYEQLLLNKASFQCNICDYRDMVLRKTKGGKLVSLESFKRFIRMTD